MNTHNGALDILNQQRKVLESTVAYLPVWYLVLETTVYGRSMRICAHAS